MSNVPSVTRNIIIVNCIIFVATLLNKEFMIENFALFYPTSRYFKWWQPITHMFMHGGLWHILFNMYTLYLFGSVVENVIGSKKFFIFYFICGLGAAALHMGVEYLQLHSYMGGVALGNATAIQNIAAIKLTPTVGASGAIYGVLIGYAMLFPQSRLTLLFPPISLSAKWMVTVFVVIELLTGVVGINDGVAHFAHLGGMLIGYLMILYWRKMGRLFDKDNF